MKRNPKPFSVEIKKSRIQGQRHQLPPRRLFEVRLPTEATNVVQKDEPEVAAEPPAPQRILPSLIEPAWSNPEAVEPVRRKRSSESKTESVPMELDLDAIISDDVKDAPAEASVISQAMSRADATRMPEGLTSADEIGPQVHESAKSKLRKRRTKAPEAVEQVMASDAVAEAEQALGEKMITPSPVRILLEASRRRLANRQAAAAQLPRHERWKRRLHPASW